MKRKFSRNKVDCSKVKNLNPTRLFQEEASRLNQISELEELKDQMTLIIDRSSVSLNNKNKFIKVRDKIKTLEKMQEYLYNYILAGSGMQTTLDESPEPAISEVEAELKNVDFYNTEARNIKSRNKIRAELKEKKGESEKLTKEIEKVDGEKLDLLASAKLPADMTIEDGEIKIDGLCWENQSTAERLKTAMKIGFRDKSPMKLMKIINWNNLDKENKEAVIGFINGNNYIAFIESVCDEKTGDMIFIENGEIK